jgi:hypothetical protein
MAGWRPFGHTCFCTMSCGYLFGLRLAELDQLLLPAPGGHPLISRKPVS